MDETQNALKIIEGAPPPALIAGAVTPEDLVERATAMANALAPIVEAKELYVTIGSGKHLVMEAWATLGAMVGVFPEVDWTRPIERGWEARCQVRHMGSGQIIGAAEAQCLNTEQNWRGKEDFAIRSMAQTRAAGKALRLPLSWIVVLAGYKPTPAEEMDYEAAPPAAPPPKPRPRPRQATAQPQPAANGTQSDSKAHNDLRQALRSAYGNDLDAGALAFVRGYVEDAVTDTVILFEGLTVEVCQEMVMELEGQAATTPAKGGGAGLTQ